MIMKIYVCIDLKSFYASVECRERGLDPMTTNLVVADESRTEKTICLAVSPSLKRYGIPGRARLFEVNQKVREVNYLRRRNNYEKPLTGKSFNSLEIDKNKNLEIDFIKAPPRMAKYIKYSTDIYNIYLKYLDKSDIYVYSIDEVFCEITNYLKCYKMSPRELVTKIIHEIYEETGITATAGIGTNLYLAKVAMDIVAKHTKADKYGVRIAGLDEKTYRKRLWDHQPLTDFWRVGSGYQKKLHDNKIYTMGDIAKCSVVDEDKLYKLFGVNAELLIDHAWGWEPCTIKDIKSYKPSNNSLTSGQVLHCAYNYEKTKLVVKEMADQIALDLVKKKLVTKQIVLTLGYDIENLRDEDIMKDYHGEVVRDRYGRMVPKSAHGTINLEHLTSAASKIREATEELYDRIVNRHLLIKRINLVVCNVVREEEQMKEVRQYDLFTDYQQVERDREKELEEEKVQNIMLEIKNKYGKNAILKGMNLVEGATIRDRNQQIGGHHE